MKIVHVIPGLEIRGGGGNRACAELCESLVALGHQVTLNYVSNGDGGCFSPKGVKVRDFPSEFLHRYGYSPLLRAHLKEEIHDADIVHIHATWQYPSIPASRFAQEYGVPYVVQPHGNLHAWKLNHKFLRKKLYWTLVERHTLQKAEFIHVESEADESDIKACLPGARTVISPCGSYSKAFAEKGPVSYISKRWPLFKEKRCILYLARIDVNKGVDILLKSFAKLTQHKKNIALLLVGPDYAGTTAKMQGLSNKLGISDRVVWAGMVSEKERIWILLGLCIEKKFYTIILNYQIIKI